MKLDQDEANRLLAVAWTAIAMAAQPGGGGGAPKRNVQISQKDFNWLVSKFGCERPQLKGVSSTSALKRNLEDNSGKPYDSDWLDHLGSFSSEVPADHIELTVDEVLEMTIPALASTLKKIGDEFPTMDFVSTWSIQHLLKQQLQNPKDWIPFVQKLRIRTGPEIKRLPKKKKGKSQTDRNQPPDFYIKYFNAKRVVAVLADRSKFECDPKKLRTDFGTILGVFVKRIKDSHVLSEPEWRTVTAEDIREAIPREKKPSGEALIKQIERFNSYWRELTGDERYVLIKGQNTWVLNCNIRIADDTNRYAD